MGNRGSMHGKRHGSVWQSGGEFTPASKADVDARDGLSLQTAEFGIPGTGRGGVNFSYGMTLRLTGPSELGPKEGTLVNMSETWFCVDRIPGMGS